MACLLSDFACIPVSIVVCHVLIVTTMLVEGPQLSNYDEKDARVTMDQGWPTNGTLHDDKWRTMPQRKCRKICLFVKKITTDLWKKYNRNLSSL